MKKVFVLIILIVGSIAACSSDGIQFTKSTPTPIWASCGVTLVDHNVKMWAEGNYALEICESIMRENDMRASSYAERSMPWPWTKRVSGYSYFVVCSEEWSDLIYEVIDTGGAYYGGEWCGWLHDWAGTHPKMKNPDIFGLIGP